MSNPRKIELMHQQFGKSAESHICGECSNFRRYRHHDRFYKKCTVYGETNSEASDWAKKYEACGMFNEEYNGKPIIEIVKHNKRVEPEPMIDGQITM